MPRHKEIVVIVGDTYKKNLLFRFVVESVASIWINRGAGDRAALKVSLEVLKRGQILGIAPEGTRSKTGKLQQGKTGAAFLAMKANVPIVPVGLIGTEKAFNDLKHLRRPKLHVKFGKPLRLPTLAGEHKAALLDDYTHELMCRIAALLPNEYHGFYEGDKRIQEIQVEMGQE
jgi:1-acyl-sn-glycerol-3-phosphate acyltransferase